MRFSLRMWVGMILAGATYAAGAAEPCADIVRIEGRVLLRADGVKKLEPVESGRALNAGEVLLTGDQSRYEVRPREGGGLWRVGRRAVFAFKTAKQGGGARLLAGTALVQVPANQTRHVESTRCVLVLPAGTWLVHAVDNRGFKIVCLDGEDAVTGRGEATAPTEEALASVRLKPGELVFLQPDGKSFSPVVTVYLEEVLATSRLVAGFSDELPGLRRLMNLAVAQRERLKGVSNATVVGATDAGAFQIAVPSAPEAKPKKEK